MILPMRSGPSQCLRFSETTVDLERSSLLSRCFRLQSVVRVVAVIVVEVDAVVESRVVVVALVVVFKKSAAAIS